MIYIYSLLGIHVGIRDYSRVVLVFLAVFHRLSANSLNVSVSHLSAISGVLFSCWKSRRRSAISRERLVWRSPMATDSRYYGEIQATLTLQLKHRAKVK